MMNEFELVTKKVYWKVQWVVFSARAFVKIESFPESEWRMSMTVTFNKCIAQKNERKVCDTIP
jgi:hypothetical protein